MRHHQDERGAILVMFALVITALLVIVAIVIDLGATRSDRRGGQLAVDNAVAAAAREVPETGAAAACVTALDYLEATLDAATFTITDGPTCPAKFPATPLCVNSGLSATAPRVLVAKSGPYTVRISHPVSSTASATQHLMNRTSTINAQTFGATSDDGKPCNRIGVELTTQGADFFGQLAGSSGRSSTVHAVAYGEEVTGPDRPINLLVLNRTSCQALTVGGSSNVVVEIPTDGPSVPGIIGLDSDATAGCGGGKAALEVSGTLLAKGPCDDGVSTNCGILDIFAAVPNGACTKDGIDVPACKTIGGGPTAASDLKVQPDATTMAERVTRSPFEHLYNCQSSYVSKTWYAAQSIAGCTTRRPYVDELRNFASTMSASNLKGFTSLPSASVPGFESCNVINATIPQGNYYVDCPTFKVSASGTVDFQGGNVVFGGKVEVPGGGTLLVHSCSEDEPVTCGTLSSPWETGDDFDESTWSGKNAWVYLQNEFGAAGNVTMNNVTLFIDGPGYFNKNGGGTTTWIAPDEDGDDDSAGPFDDLSMWSTSTAKHTFAGGGSSTWEGVFFGADALFDFGGTAPMNMTAAQFASDKVEFSGATDYTMSPVADRAVSTSLGYRTSLIR